MSSCVLAAIKSHTYEQSRFPERGPQVDHLLAPRAIVALAIVLIKATLVPIF